MTDRRSDPPPESTPHRYGTSTADTPGAFGAWTPPLTTQTHNTPRQPALGGVGVRTPPPVQRNTWHITQHRRDAQLVTGRNTRLVTPQDIESRRSSRLSPTFERIIHGENANGPLEVGLLEAQLRWLVNRERQVRAQLEELRRRGGEVSSSRARMVSSPSDFSGTQELFNPAINF